MQDYLIGLTFSQDKLALRDGDSALGGPKTTINLEKETKIKIDNFFFQVTNNR